MYEEAKHSRITAMVTLFHPEEKNVENIRKISQCVDRIILCDNSGCDKHNLFSDIDNSTYINNHRNLGLSAAYNVALRDELLDWHPDDFIIFFDQDSVVSRKHVEKLIKVYLYLENKGLKVGCLGPAYYNAVSGEVEVVKGKQIHKQIYKVNKIITSSMLVRHEIIEKIDFFNDKIFLDYADWDLCWRLGKVGYGCYTTTAAKFEHSVGIGTKRIGPLSIRVWNPIRTYYQVRDGKYLLKQEYVPIHDRLQIVYMTTVLPKLNVRYLDRKDERERFYKRALNDAKSNISGEFK